MQKRLVRAPELKGADVLKKNWDPKRTLRQNYERLGLVGDLRLNDAGGAGGSGSGIKGKERPADQIPRSKRGALGSTMARIVRDEEGNVVDVVEDRPRRAQTVWGQALNSDEEDGDEEEEEDEEDGEDGRYEEREEAEEEEDKEDEGQVVKKLQELADAKTPVPRFTSVAERTWLQRLVDKFGDDVEQMARDKTDNVWQKTAGDIKKA
ncbi:hypothetical protein L7F22_003400 [Adiantum nelumboides]|nr:hypothetical protein [Adiantum nelumboides]